jgi:pimeloyl-ACP methyl ester carboxylesterase
MRLRAALTAALGMCAFAAPGTQAAGRVAPSTVAAPMRSVRVPWGRIGYRSIGHGRPLVLVVGSSASIDIWAPRFLDALALRHRLLVFDNEGLGARRSGLERCQSAGWATTPPRSSRRCICDGPMCSAGRWAALSFRRWQSAIPNRCDGSFCARLPPGTGARCRRPASRGPGRSPTFFRLTRTPQGVRSYVISIGIVTST